MDHLAVIADARISPPGDAAIVRFAGTPEAGEATLANISILRDAAAAVVKERFGPWLYRWALESGILGLAEWWGYSWWWYAPLSERSPMRSDIIVRLHQFLILRMVLERDRPKRLTWFDTDPAIHAAIAAIARPYECDTWFFTSGKAPRRQKILFAALLRFYALSADIIRWLIFKVAGPKLRLVPSPRVLFTSRFPRLWEQQSEMWRERMFGRLPDVFGHNGWPAAYVIMPTGNPLAWLKKLRMLRRAMLRNSIIPYHAAATLWDVVAAHFTPRLWIGYVWWRWSHRRKNVLFDGIDVTHLLNRELSLAVLDSEIPYSRLIARALPKLLKRFPEISFVVHPFEFQPSERAIRIGAGKRAKVIGLQTGVYTSGQLGFLPFLEEIEPVGDLHRDFTRAPMPDLLVTYGQLMTDLYTQVLGADRVQEVGALRYGELAQLLQDIPERETIRRELDLPEHYRFILVACPSMPEEAWPMVRAALSVAENDKSIFLIFKFHYHFRIDAEVARLAQERIENRWRVASVGLTELLIASDIVITGATSVSYEALALNRDVLVYLRPAEWHCNPAVETPEAFRFWHDRKGLEALLFETSGRSTPISQVVRDSALRSQLKLRVEGDEELRMAMVRLAAKAGNY